MNGKYSLLFVIVIFVFSITQSGTAQVDALASPEQTIASLFKSMYDGDGILAEKVFAEDASLHSVYTTEAGEQKVKLGEVVNFIEAISEPHEVVWDERVSNLTVKIDGDLAQAWMDYSFYLGDKFSHCGVNAIHLIRLEGVWKIFQIVDTRRKSDCN